MIALSEKEPGSAWRNIAEARKRMKSRREGDAWRLYNHSIESYNYTFEGVSDYAKISDYLSTKPNPVVIDIMSSSSAIASIFEGLKSNNKLGIAVTLTDQRDEFEVERDDNLGITQISGDVTRKSTWTEIERELAGRKADLIMERAEGGLTYVPNDEVFGYISLRNAWNLLSENFGVMLVQASFNKSDDENYPRIKQWTNFLNKNGVEAQSSFNYETTIKIIRSPLSPKDLPKL